MGGWVGGWVGDKEGPIGRHLLRLRGLRGGRGRTEGLRSHAPKYQRHHKNNVRNVAYGPLRATFPANQQNCQTGGATSKTVSPAANIATPRKRHLRVVTVRVLTSAISSAHQRFSLGAVKSCASRRSAEPPCQSAGACLQVSGTARGAQGEGPGIAGGTRGEGGLGQGGGGGGAEEYPRSDLHVALII